MSVTDGKPKNLLAEALNYILATALLIGAYLLGNLAVALGFGSDGNYGTLGGVILAVAQTWFSAVIFVIIGGQVARFSARHLAAPPLGFGIIGLAFAALAALTAWPAISARPSDVYEFVAGLVSAGGLTAIGIYVLKNK